MAVRPSTASSPAPVRTVVASGAHAASAPIARSHNARHPARPGDRRHRVEAGESLTIEERIPLPPDPPLTFTGRENRLDWLVEVTVSVSGWADWKGTFPVIVGPAAALAAAGIVAITEPIQSRS